MLHVKDMRTYDNNAATASTTNGNLPNDVLTTAANANGTGSAK